MNIYNFTNNYFSVEIFRKKPIEVEAIQYFPKLTCGPIARWMNVLHNEEECFFYSSWMIETLEGTMEAKPGDWIIRGISGEFYPCKLDIFFKTYELVV